MIPAFSKHFLVSIGLIPLMLNAATPPPQQAPQKPCEAGCPFSDLQQLERFFSQPFPRVDGAYSYSSMKETEKAYLISIDLPGMDKKDIAIETSGHRLMVSGERKEDSETKESSKHAYAKFRQSYLLPEDANMEAIEATSKNGVLKITVPKTGEKTAKKVEIK